MPRVTKKSKAKTQPKTKKPRSVKARQKSHIPKLSAQVFDVKGKPKGTLILPKEIFGQKPTPQLLAQAIRVYQSNRLTHFAHTKTRGEVRGGGRKPWRQKGTGNARAGSIRSPLWVGGGIALGPRHREAHLSLPKKIKRKALVSALSDKLNEKSVYIIENIEKIEPKTKIIASLLKNLPVKGQSLLLVSQNPKTTRQNVKLASRNIPHITVQKPQNLNAYEVIKNNQILFSREALSQLQDWVVKR